MLQLSAKFRRALMLTGLFSLAIALLSFVLPLYMMAIYNRVLSTYSIETLQFLSLIAVFLLIVMAFVETGRTRLQNQVNAQLAKKLDRELFSLILSRQKVALGVLSAYDGFARTQAFGDLQVVCGFIGAGGFSVFFDLLFAPIFVVALFILSPLIGSISLIAATVLLGLAMLGEFLSARGLKEASVAEAKSRAVIEGSLTQEDAVRAMGMSSSLFENWSEKKQEGDAAGLAATKKLEYIKGLSKGIRQSVQIAILGFGAWLVISGGEFLAGAIIASSILMGRALAPIDQSISMWKSFVTARQAAKRLAVVANSLGVEIRAFEMPEPEAKMTISSLALRVSNRDKPLVQGVNLTLSPGDVVVISGPNAVGKTTLLKTLCGTFPPTSGSVQWGKAAVSGYSEAHRRQLVGYLPQNVQLFPGSLGQNIARFQDHDDEALNAAAMDAGAFDLVQAQLGQYATDLDHAHLSSGQVQLIGLARAIYGNPKFLFMDEPTANLDDSFKNKFIDLIKKRRADQLLTIFVTHDPSLIPYSTHAIVMMPNVTFAGQTKDVIADMKQHGQQISGAV